jgi:hypothetical protein
MAASVGKRWIRSDPNRLAVARSRTRQQGNHNLGVLQKRGIFRGLDADGAMMLETKDGPQRITAGDVAFGVA